MTLGFLSTGTEYMGGGGRALRFFCAASTLAAARLAARSSPHTLAFSSPKLSVSWPLL